MPDRPQAERLQLVVALPLERQDAERERSEEGGRFLARDDEYLARAGDARSGERCELSLGCARAGIPAGAHSGERPAKDALHAAVQTLYCASFHVETPRLGGLDGEPFAFEPAHDLFPGLLRRRGSCSTSVSDGHVASASPSSIPGRTPAISAAAVTAPISCLCPGTGASAAG